jgi:hypothetical protein
MIIKNRLWISVITGLVAVILIVWLSPSPNSNPHGVLLPAKTQLRVAISPLNVAQVSNPPVLADNLGKINIEQRDINDPLKAEQMIWQLAKKLAAQAGANAVYGKIWSIPGGATGAFYIFHGTAYYVHAT